MNRQDKIKLIIEYFNEHFKFQKLIYGWRIDISKFNALTDKELDKFIAENCK